MNASPKSHSRTADKSRERSVPLFMAQHEDPDPVAGPSTAKHDHKCEKTEEKAGVKRKDPDEETDDNTDDGEDDVERNWGPDIRAPEDRIPPREIIIGKMAKNYRMLEIRRILQHFHCLDRVSLRATKNDLLQALIDLSEEKRILPQDRCWIMRQPLGPGGVRFQTLEQDGRPSRDSYPAGHAPKKRKTNNCVPSSSKGTSAWSLPRPSASKAMPDAPRFTTYTSMSSTAEGKKPGRATAITPKETQELQGQVLMVMQPVIHAIAKQLESQILPASNYEEIANQVVAKLRNEGVTDSSTLAALLQETLKRAQITDPGPEHPLSTSDHQESPGSPESSPLIASASLRKMMEITDDDTDDDSYSDDE